MHRDDKAGKPKNQTEVVSTGSTPDMSLRRSNRRTGAILKRAHTIASIMVTPHTARKMSHNFRFSRPIYFRARMND
jgi:hypothetical protein